MTKKHPVGTISSWLFGLLGVAGVTFIVLRFGDLEAFGHAIRHARPSWLIGALLLQIGTYFSVAGGWNTVLSCAGARQPLQRLVPIAITKLFADQVLPSAGMGGNVLLINQLIKIGVPRPAAVAALLISMVGYYLAYGVLALVMLLLLWMHGKATPLLVGIVTSFLLVALAIPLLALWLRGRGSRPLPRRIERLRPLAALLHVMGEAPRALIRNRWLLRRVAFLNGLVFVTDASTLLLCMLALGHSAGFATAFIALMLASIVVTLAPVPLGLGGFEASCTAMLVLLGTPSPIALAATLLFRGLTLWLPLLLGMAMIRHNARRGRAGSTASLNPPPEPPVARFAIAAAASIPGLAQPF